MVALRFSFDEALVMFEDEDGEIEVDVPVGLYISWRRALNAVQTYETQIVDLHRAQRPYVPHPSEPVIPATVTVTGAIPAPRTLAAYQQAQEG